MRRHDGVSTQSADAPQPPKQPRRVPAIGRRHASCDRLRNGAHRSGALVKLSIVIPARNEGPNLQGTVQRLHERLALEGISDYEIVVVDDGSTDDTPTVLEGLCRIEPKVRRITNTGRHGYGRAVRLGLHNCTGDAIVITMADASDDPEDVAAYYRVLRDESECVFGSRFIRGSELVDYPRVKLVINRLVNLAIKLIFNIKCNDVTNAFKGFRRYVIDGCQPLISPHFNLTIEIPLKAVVRGYSYKVLPVAWRNRTSGTSQLVLKEQGSRYLYTLLSVWFEWLLVRGDFERQDRDSVDSWEQHARRESGCQTSETQ